MLDGGGLVLRFVAYFVCLRSSSRARVRVTVTLVPASAPLNASGRPRQGDPYAVAVTTSEADAATLLYDDECARCVRAAERVARRWPDGVARAVPARALDDEVLARLGLGREEVVRSAWWIEDSKLFEGSAAIAKALMASGGVRALLGRALLVAPLSWLARAGYRVVARRRRRAI